MAFTIDDLLNLTAPCASLPRLARIRFLANCAERLQPLYATFWLRPLALSFSEELSRGIEVIDSYASNPHSIERTAIEQVQGNATAAWAACVGECKSERAYLPRLVAEVVHSLAELAIKRHADADQCASICVVAFAAACEDYDTLVRTLRFDLEALQSAAGSNQWTDDSPANIPLRPVWRFGKPRDWPEERIAAGLHVASKLAAGGYLGKILKTFSQ